MCEICFGSGEVKHQHARFCNIDERGQHSEACRTVAPSPLLKLTKVDFSPLSLADECLTSKNYCNSCYEIFTENCIPVTTPGCDLKHGIAEFDRNSGAIVDSHGYYCSDCSILWHSSRGLNYCDIVTFCAVCKHMRERNELIRDFMAEKSSLELECASVGCNDDYGVRKQQLVENLKSLHKQPWIIQKIIDDCFL